jgi:hypothetical protein
LDFCAGDLRNSESAAASTLALPISHEHADSDIEHAAATPARIVSC